MRPDESGVDTVFGALILIISCMVASSIMLSTPERGARGGPDSEELEGQFDCILSSTIEVARPDKDGAAHRVVPISVYLMEFPAENLSPPDISSVVDFYMARFDGWVLQISWDDGRTAEVASRSPGAVGGSDTYVLERIVPDAGNGNRGIRLLLAG